MQTRFVHYLKSAVKHLTGRVMGRKYYPNEIDYTNVVSFLEGINPKQLVKINPKQSIRGINLTYDISDLGLNHQEILSPEETLAFFKKYFGPKSSTKPSYCKGAHCSSKKKGIVSHRIDIKYGNLEKEGDRLYDIKPYRTISLECALDMEHFGLRF